VGDDGRELERQASSLINAHCAGHRRFRLVHEISAAMPTCEDLFKGSFGIFFADAMAAIAVGPAPVQLLRSSIRRIMASFRYACIETLI
jgi:hypothetical protein